MAIVAKMRLKRARTLLPRVGGFSVLFGLLILVTSIQSEATVPLAFAMGWSQIFIGGACILVGGVKASVAPWIIGSLGIACVVQMYGVMLSVRGNYDLR